MNYHSPCVKRANSTLTSKSTQTTIDDFCHSMRDNSINIKKVKLIEFSRFLNMNKKFKVLIRDNEKLVEKLIELTTNDKLKKANLI